MASPLTASHWPSCLSRSSKIGMIRPSGVGPTFRITLPPQLWQRYIEGVLSNKKHRKKKKKKRKNNQDSPIINLYRTHFNTIDMTTLRIINDILYTYTLYAETKQLKTV